MKGIVFLLAASIAAGVAQGQVLKDAVLPNPVRVSTRLQLIVTLDRASVRAGGTVWVRAHYKNVSSNGIDLTPTARRWDLAYALTVTDASGAEVPRTAEGESWLRSQREPEGSFSLEPIRLDPGAEGEEFVVDAARYYNLSKPGTYFVRLMFRSLWPDPNEPKPTTSDPQKVPVEEAVSNVVQLTITP